MYLLNLPAPPFLSWMPLDHLEKGQPLEGDGTLISVPAAVL